MHIIHDTFKTTALLMVWLRPKDCFIDWSIRTGF